MFCLHNNIKEQFIIKYLSEASVFEIFSASELFLLDNPGVGKNINGIEKEEKNIIVSLEDNFLKDLHLRG